MPEQIMIDTNAVYAWCIFIAAIGVAIGWLAKATKPMLKPFKKLQQEVKDIEACEEKDRSHIEQHEKALVELTNDNRMIMESIALLMKHAETGNNTGEISRKRQELEKYLINR